MATRAISGDGRATFVAPSRSEALSAALVALALGGLLVFLAGFAYPEAVHNAAHDTRHTLSFPCH
jgi:cobalt transporter subunit CbtB